MPAGPPPSSHITAALSRWARLLHLPRLVPPLLVVGAVAVVTVGAPMVSGAVTSFPAPGALEPAPPPADAPPGAASSGGLSAPGGWVAAPLVQRGVDGPPPPHPPAPPPAAPSSVGA